MEKESGDKDTNVEVMGIFGEEENKVQIGFQKPITNILLGNKRSRKLKYQKSIRTIQKYLDSFSSCTREVAFSPRHPLCIVLDASFFGRRYGILVARSARRDKFSEAIQEWHKKWENFFPFKTFQNFIFPMLVMVLLLIRKTK